MKLQRNPAQGANPFANEPCAFKAKPAIPMMQIMVTEKEGLRASFATYSGKFPVGGG